ERIDAVILAHSLGGINHPELTPLVAADRAVAARYKVSIRPTLVFARDGAVLGALPRMRDWAVYLDEVSRLLAGAGEGVS
ncbi:MAG: hypothetical protein B7X08_00365, partial [Acidocella sp. 20-63-7]